MLFYQRTKFIVWYVDLTPNYNKNILIRYIMRSMEKIIARCIILRVENNIFAAREREKRTKWFHHREIAIVPIGVNSIPANFEKKKFDSVEIAFLGNLNERNGALFLDKIMESSIIEKKNWIFHVIGQGEFLELLTSKYSNSFFSNILIHGPILNEVELNNILSRCTFGLAPYQNISDTFTVFADPGKYTKYLVAGCVIISTEIPLMSKVLEEKAGLIILNHNLPPSHWIREITFLSKNKTDIENRTKMGFDYVTRLHNDVNFKVLCELIDKLV